MTAAELAAVEEWGVPTPRDLAYLEHLWNGAGAGYDDECPHDCQRGCGGQGCHANRFVY